MDPSDVPLELAIAVLDDETRLAIFEELWRESWDFDAAEYGVSFEELRRTVGVENSSRLSYHLDRLRRFGEPFDPDDSYGPDAGTPVRGSTRSQLVIRDDDRYYLDRNLGHRVYQLWALAQPSHEPIGPTEVPWECPHCDRGLTATYRHHRLDCWCDEHGSSFWGTLLPGNAEEHSAADLVKLAAIDKARDRQHLLAGFCMSCWGPVEGSVVSVDDDHAPVADVLDDVPSFPHRIDEDDDSGAAYDEPLGYRRSCRNCEFDWAPGVGLLACYRPAVSNFLAANGVDVTTEPMVWRFVEDASVIRSVDPLRIEVIIEVEGTSRTFVLDEKCTVVSTE